MRKTFPIILPFLFLSIFALLMGFWAGLVRLGWSIPAGPAALPVQHGPLMISGFLGTMIALERTAAIRLRWMYSAPFFSGAGWVLSLALPHLLAGPLFITVGSLVTSGILAYMVRREPKVFTATMAAGAICWLVGNLLWIFGTPIPLVVWWWAAFLVLTIAGERLELSRVMRLQPRHFRLFTLAAVLFLFGAALSTGLPEAGARIIGVGMLALSAWLLKYDIARRNIRRQVGLPRFIAACLFTGYLWLGAGGLMSLWYGMQYGGFIYDAILHSVFVGFVLSMIFGHAPIIFPALAQMNVVYHRSFYLPFILLHGSLILRVSGDLAGWIPGRMWGGFFNEVALLAFMGLFILSIVQQKRASASPARREKQG
jgi:hypothetical protein